LEVNVVVTHVDEPFTLIQFEMKVKTRITSSGNVGTWIQMLVCACEDTYIILEV